MVLTQRRLKQLKSKRVKSCEATVWCLGVKALLTCLPPLDPFSAALVS